MGVGVGQGGFEAADFSDAPSPSLNLTKMAIKATWSEAWQHSPEKTGCCNKRDIKRHGSHPGEALPW